jgi:hypothetical protein
MIVKEVVNKSNHPIQNPLLFVTDPRTRENEYLENREIWFYYGGSAIVAKSDQSAEKCKGLSITVL